MKKKSKGFVLAETLIVTAFVAGILIYIYIQLSNLTVSYEKSHKYNTVNNIYALEDLKDYIKSDLTSMLDYVTNNNFVELSDCNFKNNGESSINLLDSTKLSYCKSLFNLENFNIVLITSNDISTLDFSSYDEELKTFISNIESKEYSNYRIIASFKDGTFATIKFNGV